MAQSAFKKYAINDFGPGDITSGVVTDSFDLGGGPFSSDISYYKAGNLYFGFNSYNMSGGSPVGIICDDGGSNAVNAARLATLLGVTVNTIYTVTADVAAGTNTGKRVTYSGSDWTDNGVATGSILYAFLAN